MTTSTRHRLTPEELERFQRDGFVGPFTFAGEDEMATLRAAIEREVLDETRSVPGRRFVSRHRDCSAVYDLCADDRLVGRVASLLGEDVVLWNSVFFCKGPGGRQIPWHQDRDFLFLDPNINVQVWLAIDDATLENGCLRVIPGSHEKEVPHLPATAKYQFTARADPRFVDAARAVPLPMKAGELIVVHKDLLHHSTTNLTLTRRMGLVVRYTVPGVRVNDDGITGSAPVYRVRGAS